MSGLLAAIAGRAYGKPGLISRCCRLVMDAVNEPMYQHVLSVVSLNKDSCMLDVGFGDGRLISRLFLRFHPMIYGIDLSPDMKRAAEARCASAKRAGKLRLSVGSVCRLPYADDSFDCVTSVNSICFWEDTMEGLRQVRRVLKKGACFCSVVYTRQWLEQLGAVQAGVRLFDREDYIRDGKEAGFSSVYTEEIAPDRSFAVVYIK